jgi:hypothetical protein
MNFLDHVASRLSLMSVATSRGGATLRLELGFCVTPGYPLTANRGQASGHD